MTPWQRDEIKTNSPAGKEGTQQNRSWSSGKLPSGRDGDEDEDCKSEETIESNLPPAHSSLLFAISWEKLDNLYSTEGVESDASARSLNLTFAPCDFVFDLLTLKVEYFTALPHGPLVPVFSKIVLFVFETSSSQDWRTNERRGREHYSTDQFKLSEPRRHKYRSFVYTVNFTSITGFRRSSVLSAVEWSCIFETKSWAVSDSSRSANFKLNPERDLFQYVEFPTDVCCVSSHDKLFQKQTRKTSDNSFNTV